MCFLVNMHNIIVKNKANYFFVVIICQMQNRF